MIGFSRFEAVWITNTPPINIEITPTRRIDESMSLSDSLISCLQKNSGLLRLAEDHFQEEEVLSYGNKDFF